MAKKKRIRDRSKERSRSPYVKARRLRFIASGVCAQCGKVPPATGILMCAGCREKSRRGCERRNRARAAEFLCVEHRCNRRRVFGKQRCEKHLAESREQFKNLRRRRKAAGLCLHCGDPVMPGRNHCLKHLAYVQDMLYRANRRLSNRFYQSSNVTKKRGWAWDLTREQYEQIVSRPCHYCRMPIENAAGCGLDRLDNQHGYTTKNVVSCCKWCNFARRNLWTPEEMLTFIGPAIRRAKLHRNRVSDIMAKRIV